MVTIISLGGSIVAPNSVDTEFLSRFVASISAHLAADPDRKVILIVGGGGPARIYQTAYRAVVKDPSHDNQDWIGIMATRLNAELVRACLGDWCRDTVVTDPSAPIGFAGQALVAAGWKPGFSTDFDAVWLAERFGAKTVINLSNIAKVYTDDPKTNPQAKPLDAITWTDFRAMVGDVWEPGKNCPFDPVASRKASELELKVICAAGHDLPNLLRILAGQSFTGTTIGA
jgi:uridylate kinase